MAFLRLAILARREVLLIYVMTLPQSVRWSAVDLSGFMFRMQDPEGSHSLQSEKKLGSIVHIQSQHIAQLSF